MGPIDYRAELKPWKAAAQEMARLAAKLPDGAERLLAFNERMLAATTRCEFMTDRPETVHGIIVIVAEPGPAMLEFMVELRAAVAGLGAA